jgi:thiosulfate dehydrogenase [quinone] large subunit
MAPKPDGLRGNRRGHSFYTCASLSPDPATRRSLQNGSHPAYSLFLNQESPMARVSKHVVVTRKGGQLQDPPLVVRLLSDPRAGWLWVLPRVWLGYQWFAAGLEKIESPGWVQTGASLKGFWSGAVAVSAAGKSPIVFAWYRSFLQYLLDAQAYTWFAKLVAYGELTIGIALMIGAFTGIAAFFGGLMNWNYMMAGSASTNPLLFVIAVALILAWKVSGDVGADNFLLRWIGTPWRTVPVDLANQPSLAPRRSQ